MWSKNKRLLLIILAATLVLLAAGALLLIGFLPGYQAAKNTMDPNGMVTISVNEDGTLQMEWPAGENAESYHLQIFDTDGQVLHSYFTAECFARLPQLPADRELTLRITSYHSYGKKTRAGKEPLEATAILNFPQIQKLNWEANAETGIVDVDFDMSGSDLCHVYMATGDGDPTLVEQLENAKLQMKFGDGEKYAIPSYDAPLNFSFRLGRTAGNVTYLGAAAAGFTLQREDLLGTTLNLRCTASGDNSYTLTWDETKGEYYDVRLSDDGGATWMTMAYIAVDRDRTYTTPSLPAFADYVVQVVAVGGQTLPDSEFAAVSETFELQTDEKLLYSTIWPLMDLVVYDSPECAQELGTAAAGSAWCVLGQEGKFLKIRYQGWDAYIDGDYCMINLPEYLGDLCLYNITNSYASMYTVHEYGISQVSGKVITGYENVRIAEDEYVVPLLFPTAQKLLKAALAAKEEGYTLKIYDSYRPQIATERVYSLARNILGKTVPSYTYSGKNVRDLHLLKWDPYEVEDTPDTGDVPEGETEAAGTGEPKPLTYEILMTNNGEYSLGKFLAPGTSRHNFGVALDLTMVDAEGQELSMQTSMHDLSWYSAFKRNNANANILYKFMSGAGMTNITSEWWHYQDNEIYDTGMLKPLREGVSLECWVADKNGWRYRLADGSFYANSTQTIGDKNYTFDENGYLMN